MTIATLVFPMLKSTLRIDPQAGIYGKKKPQQIYRMRVQRQRCPIICYIGQIFKEKIRMTIHENLLLSRFRKRICLETQADERSHHCVVHLYFFFLINWVLKFHSFGMLKSPSPIKIIKMKFYKIASVINGSRMLKTFTSVEKIKLEVTPWTI